jgi:hypothetical protein
MFISCAQEKGEPKVLVVEYDLGLPHFEACSANDHSFCISEVIFQHKVMPVTSNDTQFLETCSAAMLRVWQDQQLIFSNKAASAATKTS